MKVFVLLSVIILIMVITIYYPVIRQYRILKRIDHEFKQKLEALNGFYTSNVIIITRPLGEGESQNSDVKFICAHKNQEFAVNTILDLIDNWEV